MRMFRINFVAERLRCREAIPLYSAKRFREIKLMSIGKRCKRLSDGSPRVPGGRHAGPAGNESGAHESLNIENAVVLFCCQLFFQGCDFRTRLPAQKRLSPAAESRDAHGFNRRRKARNVPEALLSHPVDPRLGKRFPDVMRYGKRMNDVSHR